MPDTPAGTSDLEEVLVEASRLPFLEQFDKWPYRNLLHEYNSYSYTIVLRAVRLESLNEFKQTTGISVPDEWTSFDNRSSVIAATGGTHNFPNSYIDQASRQDQISDIFVESMTLNYPINIDEGFLTIGEKRAGYTCELHLREPNGLTFHEALLNAYNYVNPNSSRTSTLTDRPFLLSIYFNAITLETDSEKNLYDDALKSMTQHIPVFFLDSNMDINATGTKYVVSFVPYCFTGEVISGTPLDKKLTQITGKTNEQGKVTIRSYIQNLIDNMNENQRAVSTDPSHPFVTYDFKAFDEANEFLDKGLAATADLNLANSAMTEAETLASDVDILDQPLTSSNNQLNTYAEVYNKISERITSPLSVSPSADVKTAISTAAKNYGVSEEFLLQIAGKESGFDPSSQNQSSSATGLFQFIDSTWNSLAGKVTGVSTVPAANDTRKNAQANSNAAAFTMKENTALLVQNNVPVNVTSVYIMHFLGSSQGLRLLKGYVSTPNETVDDSFLEAADSNKEFFYKDSTATADQPNIDTANRARRDAKIVDNLLAKGITDKPLYVTFPPGTMIGRVFEKLFYNSEYFLEALQRVFVLDEPTIPRIKFYPTVDPDPTPNPTTNSIHRTVRFNLIIYHKLTNIPKARTTDQASKIAEEVKRRTIRKYDYLFSGGNIDITRFDIRYDHSSLYIYPASFNYLPTASAGASSVDGTNAQSASATTAQGEKINAPTTAGTLSVSGTALTATPIPINVPTAVSGKYQPEVFYRQVLMPLNDVKLIDLNIDIVGDPELIPRSENIGTSSHFEKMLEESKTRSRRNFLTGVDANFFILQVGRRPKDEEGGNTNSGYSQGVMFSGFYQMLNISAMFKENGTFMMNLRAFKSTMLTSIRDTAAQDPDQVAVLEAQLSGELAPNNQAINLTPGQ